MMRSEDSNVEAIINDMLCVLKMGQGIVKDEGCRRDKKAPSGMSVVGKHTEWG